jgi:hypothetical protein
LDGGGAVVGYLETGQQVLNRVKPHRRSAQIKIYTQSTRVRMQFKFCAHGTVIQIITADFKQDHCGFKMRPHLNFNSDHS